MLHCIARILMCASINYESMFPIVQIFMMCLNCTSHGLSGLFSCDSTIKPNSLSIGMLRRSVFFIHSATFCARKRQNCNQAERSFFSLRISRSMIDGSAIPLKVESHNKASLTVYIAPSFCFYW